MPRAREPTIQPPYTVTLPAPDASGFQGGISFQGSGWQHADARALGGLSDE